MSANQPYIRGTNCYFKAKAVDGNWYVKTDKDIIAFATSQDGLEWKEFNLISPVSGSVSVIGVDSRRNTASEASGWYIQFLLSDGSRTPTPPMFIPDGQGGTAPPPAPPIPAVVDFVNIPLSGSKKGYVLKPKLSNGVIVNNPIEIYHGDDGTDAGEAPFFNEVVYSDAGIDALGRPLTNIQFKTNEVVPSIRPSQPIVLKGGKPGDGISSSRTEYSISTSGTTPPTSVWSDSIPIITTGEFLWSKTTIMFSGNTPDQIIYGVSKFGKDGVDGTNGVNGKDGKDGKDGINGSNGTNGSDGAVGAAGADGYSVWLSNDCTTVLAEADGTTNAVITFEVNAMKGPSRLLVEVTPNDTSYSVYENNTVQPTVYIRNAALTSDNTVFNIPLLIDGKPFNKTFTVVRVKNGNPAPIPGNGMLTVLRNGLQLGATFYANQNNSTVIDITNNQGIMFEQDNQGAGWYKFLIADSIRDPSGNTHSAHGTILCSFSLFYCASDSSADGVDLTLSCNEGTDNYSVCLTGRTTSGGNRKFIGLYVDSANTVYLNIGANSGNNYFMADIKYMFGCKPSLTRLDPTMGSVFLLQKVTNMNPSKYCKIGSATIGESIRPE